MTVSVIVPAYNCAAYIAQSLRSLCEQTDRDLEIVVVDDGSTDSTLCIVDEIARTDRRVRIFKQANSGSPAAARNRGLRESTGEFIAFLDADDLYHPAKIERQSTVFRSYPHVDVVFSDVVQFTVDPYRLENECYLRDRNFPAVAAHCLEARGDEVYLARRNFYNFMSTRFTCLSTQSVMLRRRVLEREPIWFPENLLVGEDIDFWHRLALNYQIAFLNAPLSYYRHHDMSMTKHEERTLRGAIAAHQANLARGHAAFNSDERAMLRRDLAGKYFSLGYLRFKAMDMRGARENYARARVLDTSRFSYLAYMKTYLPLVFVRRLWGRSSYNASFHG